MPTQTLSPRPALRYATLLLITLALAGCAFSPTPSGQFFKPHAPRVLTIDAGFYQQQSADSRPERVQYHWTANPALFKARLNGYARALGYPVADGPAILTNRGINIQWAAQSKQIRHAVLPELDRYLSRPHTGCGRCDGLRYFDFSARRNPGRADNGDLVVVFLGLIQPHPDGLKAALSAIRFDGNGHFVRYAALPYPVDEAATTPDTTPYRKLLAQVLAD